MTTQHTPGRLAHKGSYIYAPGEGGFDVYNTDDDEANARRLVACWNACDGLPTDLIEDESIMKIDSRIRQERDELLEALILLVAGIENAVSPTFMPLVKARAAIAKAEGGAE